MAKTDDWRAHRGVTFAGLAVFPCLGGIAAAMVWGNPLIGAVAYYALLLAGLCSPEGAALCRAALGLRRIGPRVADLNAENDALRMRR